MPVVRIMPCPIPPSDEYRLVAFGRSGTVFHPKKIGTQRAMKTTGLTMLVLVVVLGGACGRGQRPDDATPRLNVLHIVIDDLRPSLGTYGNSVARTPAMDRLADLGVRFDRAYVQYPICGPSRASFLSGLRPQTTGYFGWEAPKDVTLMPAWFREHGYFTAEFGKVFHHQRLLFDDEITRFEQREGRPYQPVFRTLNPPGAWDVSDICATEDDPDGYGYLYSGVLREEDPRAAQHVVSRGALRPEGLKGGWYWQEWAEMNLPDEQTADGIVVRRAAEAMEKAVRENRPFYVAAGMRRPHQVLAAPRPYFDLYPLHEIPTPPSEPRDHLDKVPPLALNFDKSLAHRVYSDGDRRRLWRAYLANVSFVDAQVAILLSALDRLDLWKNTVVVLHSDHGWHLGEHGGLGNKDTLFEESTRSPLIIVAPGKAAGKGSPRPVELVDVFPTLAGLCGLPAPARLDGVDLQPLLEDPEANMPRSGAVSVVWRHVEGKLGRGFSGIPMRLDNDAGPARDTLGRSIRTEGWRYTEWDGGQQGIELYDMTEDPRELNNLAGESEFANVQARLKALLREVDPTAADPETPIRHSN